MSGFVNAVELALLDHLLTDPAYIPPTTMYIGLSSTTPSEAGGTFTEPTTGSYARVATTDADWGAASGTAPAVKANTAVKAFPTATADWSAGSNMTHFGLFDASTAGNLLAFGPLVVPGTATPAPKPVLDGDTASCAAGSLRLLLGDPGDTYV